MTFGDGAKGKIVGVGTFVVTGLLILQRVIHVEGLKANLLSVIQLCDLNIYVKLRIESKPSKH